MYNEAKHKPIKNYNKHHNHSNQDNSKSHQSKIKDSNASQ